MSRQIFNIFMLGVYDFCEFLSVNNFFVNVQGNSPLEHLIGLHIFSYNFGNGHAPDKLQSFKYCWCNGVKVKIIFMIIYLLCHKYK